MIYIQIPIVFLNLLNDPLQVHEWPLPKSDHQCNAVMFELLIPEHLAVIRDSLFLLRTRLLSLHTPSGEDKQRHHQQQQGFGTWLDYHELARHALNKQKHVTLVSSTKLFVNAHYSSKHVNVSKEKFLVPNGYTTTFGNKVTINIIYYNLMMNYKKRSLNLNNF